MYGPCYNPDWYVAKRWFQEVTCPCCGETWEVEFITELGWSEPVNESDLECPACGAHVYD